MIHPDGSKKKHPDRFPLLRASGDFLKAVGRMQLPTRHPVVATGGVGRTLAVCTTI